MSTGGVTFILQKNEFFNCYLFSFMKHDSSYYFISTMVMVINSPEAKNSEKPSSLYIFLRDTTVSSKKEQNSVWVLLCVCVYVSLKPKMFLMVCKVVSEKKDNFHFV